MKATRTNRHALPPLSAGQLTRNPAGEIQRPGRVDLGAVGVFISHVGHTNDILKLTIMLLTPQEIQSLGWTKIQRTTFLHIDYDLYKIRTSDQIDYSSSYPQLGKRWVLEVYPNNIVHLSTSYPRGTPSYYFKGTPETVDQLSLVMELVHLNKDNIIPFDQWPK